MTTLRKTVKETIGNLTPSQSKELDSTIKELNALEKAGIDLRTAPRTVSPYSGQKLSAKPPPLPCSILH